MRPLDGVRVLDLSRLLPGPYATLILADLGADVIKVEDTGMGDYLRTLPPTQRGVNPAFLALNRNKRGMALDLKATEGRETFLKLVETADIVVEQFRPGVMARLGLSYRELATRHPRIILASITGYGQTGPQAERAGHDLNYLALSGVLFHNGPYDNAPAVLPLQVADVAGGSLWAVISILSALTQRARSGEGAVLDISMLDGVLGLAPLITASALAAEEAIRRGRHPLMGGAPNYATYMTSDGRAMSVAALEPKFWTKVCEAIERPDLIDLPVATEERCQSIRDELTQVFMSRTQSEWIDKFRLHDACVEPVLTEQEALGAPQVQVRGFRETLSIGAGTIDFLHSPILMTGYARPPATLAPAQGEHTAQILREIGSAEADIARWTAIGVIKIAGA